MHEVNFSRRGKNIPPHISSRALGQAQLEPWEAARNVPRGPFTLTTRLGIRRYVVKSFFTTGSPIVISTPGGTESGVRPSLEHRGADCEKPLCPWRSAGTRNEETGENAWRADCEEGVASVAERARSTALLRLGASMAVVIGGRA